jgi:hypothetical protein
MHSALGYHRLDFGVSMARFADEKPPYLTTEAK